MAAGTNDGEKMARELERKDWTVNAENSRANSSPAFLALVEDVARIIRSEAHSLIGGRSYTVARTILAHLAHTHGLMIVSDFSVSEDGEVTGRLYYQDRFVPITGRVGSETELFQLIES